MRSRWIIDILYGSLIRNSHLLFLLAPHWFMCFISWLTRCEGWKNKASNDGWMIPCVRQSNSSSQTHTNVFRGLSRWRWLRVRSLAWDPEFLAGRRQHHIKSFFFFLISVLRVCGCVLWCFYASGRVSQRSFSAELLSVFLFSYVCVFPFYF